MDRTIILGTAILLGLAANGNAAERAYDFQDFNKVSASSDVDVSVLVGGDFEIATEAKSQRVLDELKVRQVGETLEISRKGDGRFIWGLADLALRASDQVRVVVTLPDLARIDARAGSDVNVSGVVTSDLEAKATSGADLDLSEISVGTIALRASSGADLTAGGECDALTARASSGAEIDAEDLICGAVIARASSGGDIEVTAQSQIIAEATSGGDIDVYGSPTKRDVRHSYSGDVTLDH